MTVLAVTSLVIDMFVTFCCDVTLILTLEFVELQNLKLANPYVTYNLAIVNVGIYLKIEACDGELHMQTYLILA